MLTVLLACPFFTIEGKAHAKIGKNTKLLEQPIPQIREENWLYSAIAKTNPPYYERPSSSKHIFASVF